MTEKNSFFVGSQDLAQVQKRLISKIKLCCLEWYGERRILACHTLATPLQGYTQILKGLHDVHMYRYTKPGPNFLTPNGTSKNQCKIILFPCYPI